CAEGGGADGGGGGAGERGEDRTGDRAAARGGGGGGSAEIRRAAGMADPGAARAGGGAGEPGPLRRCRAGVSRGPEEAAEQRLVPLRPVELPGGTGQDRGSAAGAGDIRRGVGEGRFADRYQLSLPAWGDGDS